MTRFAICISGSIRSLPRSLFLESIKNLTKKLKEYDVFFVLKTSDNYNTMMNSKNSVDSLIKTFTELNAKKIIIFNNYNNINIDKSNYGSQLLSIDLSISLACSYKSYDWFIRYRPDFILQDLNINFDNLNENTIYSTKKNDSIASDQVFMFSNKLRKLWWNKLNLYFDYRFRTPEYVIFNNLSLSIIIKNGPCFYGGLLRNNSNNLIYWDHFKPNKYVDNIIIYESEYFIQEKYLKMLLNELELKQFNYYYCDKLIIPKLSIYRF